MFALSWDPDSLKEIAMLAGLGVLLDQRVQQAASGVAALIVERAQANTWERFMNPTGALAESLYQVADSPYEIQVGSDLPYAHRREYGFKGPDSLGRMFPNDPAAHYLEDAMNEVAQSGEGMELLQNAVISILGGV
jgi:hypothetical protein